MLPFPPQGCCWMPMESASYLLFLAAVAVALALPIGLCLLSWKRTNDLTATLDSKISTLTSLIEEARIESMRLEQVIERAQPAKPAARFEALAAIEDLADEASMADSAALAKTAKQIGKLSGVVPA